MTRRPDSRYKLATLAEIDEVKHQVGYNTGQEHHDQQLDSNPEEQQIPIDPDVPIVSEITETLEAIAIDADHHSLINDNDDYDQLGNEYLDLLEEVKGQPLKERQKVTKLKNNKKAHLNAVKMVSAPGLDAVTSLRGNHYALYNASIVRDQNLFVWLSFQQFILTDEDATFAI